MREAKMKVNKKEMLLYAVTDRSWLNGRTLYSQVEEALKGGVTIVQLREKHLCEEDFLKEAKKLKSLCGKYKVPLIINDNVDIMMRSGADGVHIGQDDMDLKAVRKIVGKDKIIGVSSHNVKEALEAEKNGADYLGVGAAFKTGSKNDASVIDHAVYKEICGSVNIPVVAIGGITKDNLSELEGSGISGVAVISAIFAQDDVRSAAEDLYRRTLEMVNR